ncbi:MAG: hypothetical protein Q9222_003532 [Ikaeria aurantiellina]
MEPCLFPLLDYAIPAQPSGSQALTFVLCDDKAKSDAIQDDIGPLNLYDLLWALVLRLYTGSETVAFYTQSSIHNGDSLTQPGCICSAEISKSQAISSVVFRYVHVSSAVDSSLSKGALLLNTQIFHAPSKPMDLCCNRRAENMRLSSSMDVQSLASNGLIAVFNHCLGRLVLEIHFQSAKYTKRTILNVGNTCRAVLQSLLQNSTQTVGEIRSLSDSDLDQILTWNGGNRRSVKSTVHDEVSQHTRDRPDAPALHAWDGLLTYQELDLVSGRLASSLCDFGIRIGELVPVYFEKSLWAPVAMLGILRAGNKCRCPGGAFVPLDPSNPLERTKAVVKSINARFVLTSSCYRAIFEDLEATIVVVDDSLLRAESMSFMPGIDVSPQSPAFVLFTSGSTGQPKGVVQEHASVCTISKAYGETLHVDHNSRVLQFASYAFDVSTVDIFNTLMHGGCVCIPSEFQRRNEIISVINDMKVNWADITPSLANTFAPQDVPTLRTVILAGEEVKKEHVERWAGKVRLINCYGPSECGGCTAHEYASSDSPPDTIGRPLPCFRFWVVAEDDVNRLVSVGEVGELLVEGPTLARGYLNDELRTREAFIEWPTGLAATGGVSTSRVYRTKDLVQYRSDGALKFVGRSDTQIKIRGQRVELGEVEYQLTQQYGVAKSMVAFPKSGKYANQLVAVIERDAKGGIPDDRAAKTLMKRRLPGYMIPTIWLAIDRIPLSTSIKVDRRQVDCLLARLDTHDARLPILGNPEQSQLPPLPQSNALAHEINLKIHELLASRDNHGLPSLIGTDFRLVDVGFDSIQAITLRMWMKKRYGVDVPISKLTSDMMSVSGLADLIHCPLETASTVKLFQDVENMYSGLVARNIQPTTMPVGLTGRPKLVFLTGATGYLGREILCQLLSRADVEKIIVLIRCQNPAGGYARLATVVGGDAILRCPERIEIWPGDLEQTRLGLADEHWETLSKDVDVIIHNGAVVRWNAGYESLRKANVLSTMEMCKAVLQSPVIKSFVYVSGGQQLTPGEDNDAAANLQPVTASSGYSQTKLASEVLVKLVAVGGQGSHHRFSIVKPSYIIGSARDGVANTTDYLWRLVAGAIEIGAHNGDERDTFLYLSDIETVARSTIRVAMKKPSGCTTNKADVVKILDGVPTADFWQVVREAGFPLRPIPSEQWWSAMRANVQERGEKHCLWPLMWMLEDKERTLGTTVGGPHSEDHDDDRKEADAMRSRLKAAVARNMRWLRDDEHFLPKC